MSERIIREFEYRLVRMIIDDLAVDGHRLTFTDEDRDYSSVELEDFMDNIDACGQQQVAAVNSAGEVMGWIVFVFGNGVSLISNYSMNLERYIDRANKLADDYDD